jgi:hypothetical protein
MRFCEAYDHANQDHKEKLRTADASADSVSQFNVLKISPIVSYAIYHKHIAFMVISIQPLQFSMRHTLLCGITISTTISVYIFAESRQSACLHARK